MLRLSAQMKNLSVMSLRTGGKVATATMPIINPDNLKIVGWHCEDHFSKQNLILLSQDVRDFVPQGIAVNDHSDLSEPDELIRLQDVLKLEFEIIGKQVVTDQKRRVGKVSDYATDIDSLIITKLYASRPIYKSLTEGQRIIDRKQIIEITNKKVIVKDVDIKAKSKERSTATAIAA